MKHFGRKPPVAASGYSKDITRVEPIKIDDDIENHGNSLEKATHRGNKPFGVHFEEQQTDTIKDSTQSKQLKSIKDVAPESRKRKTTSNYEEILRDGYGDDLRYLNHELLQNGGSKSAFQACVRTPDWTPAEVMRLKDWLERLGFQEQSLGNCIIFVLDKSIQWKVSR
jgi:hypothetical protein